MMHPFRSTTKLKFVKTIFEEKNNCCLYGNCVQGMLPLDLIETVYTILFWPDQESRVKIQR